MYKISKIKAITLHVRIFYWGAYSGTDSVTVALFFHYSSGFWPVPPWLVNTVFICVHEKKASRFPWRAVRVHLQRHDFSFCKSATGKSYSQGLQCACFVDFLIILYFKLLFCKNASGGSDISSTYRMENTSSLRDKVTVLLFFDKWRQIKFALALHSVPLNDSANRISSIPDQRLKETGRENLNF